MVIALPFNKFSYFPLKHTSIQRVMPRSTNYFKEVVVLVKVGLDGTTFEQVRCLVDQALDYYEGFVDKEPMQVHGGFLIVVLVV